MQPPPGVNPGRARAAGRAFPVGSGPKQQLKAFSIVRSGSAAVRLLRGPYALPRIMSSIRITRHIKAPRTSVYRALLDRDAVEAWKVPDGMISEIHEFDAREGGRLRVSLTYDEGAGTGKTNGRTDTFHGRFVKLVPDQSASRRPTPP